MLQNEIYACWCFVMKQLCFGVLKLPNWFKKLRFCCETKEPRLPKINWHGFCLYVHVLGNGVGLERKGVRMEKRIVLQSNINLEVYVFNVGRGLAVLVKTPHNYAMLYDLGMLKQKK